MKISCDMHTHTCFCDGKNTPEEMVLSAIEKGCTVYGFSGHSYTVIPGSEEWRMELSEQLEYARTVNSLKEKYSDKIKIFLGAELDYYAEPLNFKADYTIGSTHALKVGEHCFDVDNTPEMLHRAVNEYYGGDSMKMVKHFYELSAQIVDRTDCDIIGHFDLVTKFNEKAPLFDVNSRAYRSTALEALDALIEKHRVFEINTGAMSRGWRSEPYPQDFILRRLAEKNAAVILSSDCHSKDNIMFRFDEAEEYARACGIKEFFVF